MAQEDPSLVTCLECGHQAKSLARHLAKHGLNAESYRARHGEDALIISQASEKKRSKAIQASRASDKYAGFKMIPCTECGEPYKASKFSAPTRCPACKAGAEEARWEGLTEPEDYVTCLACGHRAISLVSHIQAEHPDYQARYPGTPQMAQAVTQKWHLRGVPLSEEHRARISQNAGRWNAGRTKGDHPSLARQAEKMRGKPCWSAGLTAQEDPRLQVTVEKLKLYIGENRPWHNGLRVDLTLEDIQPILDEEGRVDRQKALNADIPWQACQRYMSTYGLETSDVNVRARLKASGDRFREETIRIEKKTLLPYALKNGKISCARASAGLGFSTGVVSREIKRNGLVVARGRVKQAACMQAVSQALGGMSWKDEWQSRRFITEKGYMFKFDGYFPEVSLVVEFHGHQHFVFPNAFHKTEAQYLAARARDQHKRELIRGAEDLSYLEVRYDEPFDDVMYLRGRLAGLSLRDSFR